jgi:DNA-binding transcriptional MerR regulator
VTAVSGQLVSTGEAARRLGLSARTLTRYVAKGWVDPDLRLPSGQYRWDVERLRQQINAIPSEADDD